MLSHNFKCAARRMDSISPDQAITIGLNESNDENQPVEYSVSYLPLEDSSLHKAALFVYMGIGSEH